MKRLKEMAVILFFCITDSRLHVVRRWHRLVTMIRGILIWTCQVVIIFAE
ncbi:Uncharacterised protein [Salmonella bongori]|nr:Uncharacterised protein [Salmonella bongori]